MPYKVELEGVEPKCFLHAYLRLDFRASARPKPPTNALSPKNFISFAEPKETILDLAAPPYPQPRGNGLGETSRFSALHRNKDSLLYFDYAARA